MNIYKISSRLNKVPLITSHFKRASSFKKPVQISVDLTEDRSIVFSTGEYALLADGSVVASIGDTEVLATAVSQTKPSPGNFVPLVVDYLQKGGAAGRIPTNQFRRESGPTELEILTSRVIDRSVRPLFSDSYSYETQIMCTPFSLDGNHNPDIVAINAASAALALSDIPWNGPVGAVRVGMIDNEVLINPTRRQITQSNLNLIISATKKNMVVMLEGGADGILLQDLMKAIKEGTKKTQQIILAIEQFQKQNGKPKRTITPPATLSEEIVEALQSLSTMRVREILQNYSLDKIQRDVALSEVRTNVLEKLRTSFPDTDSNLINDGYSKVVKQIFRELIFEKDIRCDGRNLDELRHISCSVDLNKPLHGSSEFTRGQTQVRCTVTLDSHQSALRLDPLSVISSGVKEKNFFLHYSFPAFATNETGKTGRAGRREIGHGALAEKGLLPIVPPPDYPFTIRVSSEVLASNGSSSMATICGGSLALMDAGVPVSSPAAGVAIGLVTRSNENGDIDDYRLLTDLLGIEDYMGDMDFKIAGTPKGITALQADVKISGLPLKIVMEALQKANDAKRKILQIMNECIDKPRTEQKTCWPVVKTIEVEPHKRYKLLGAGGINLKKLHVETGVLITSCEDANKFEIFAPNQDALNEANERIEAMLNSPSQRELEYNEIYTGTIVEIRDIGIVVSLFPDMPPVFIHNSQLDARKVGHPSAIGLEVGQELPVKYYGRDPITGHIRLSRRAAFMGQPTPRPSSN